MSEDVMAAIDCMAYGYAVTVWINGIDIGVQGGKSESKRLFGANHSMVSELPEELKNLACLKSGENELKIAYKRLKDEDSTGMTVEVKTKEQFTNDEHVFYYRNEPNENYDLKNITGKFRI